MEQARYDRVVGCDIHQGSIVCCAIWTEDNQVKEKHREFSTFKNGLREMAEWIAEFKPDLVIMESTGIYWKSPFAHLEKRGIIAAVVNAKHIKQMEGKKTDMSDARWLAHVGRLAVFNRSFVPSVEYQSLRVPSRYLTKLTNQLASEKNRFAKVLADAGFRLNLVFSDLQGVNAKLCVDGILEGKSVEEILASIDVKRLKASRKDLEMAFEGELTEEHRYTLCEIRDNIQYLESKINKIQSYLTGKILSMHPEGLILLQTIPGISEKAAVQIIIELGGEKLDAFKNADRLVSWVGICPGNNESAGKRKHGHIRKGNSYLRRLLCECANAAVRSKGTTFQSKYQSLRIRCGTKRSLIAIAHKMLRMIYLVFERRTGYRDPQINYEIVNANKNGSRWIKMLVKSEKWNIQATNLETGECFHS